MLNDVECDFCCILVESSGPFCKQRKVSILLANLFVSVSQSVTLAVYVVIISRLI